MKKIISIVVLLCISAVAFASFHVSFARIQTGDSSIKYFRSEDFSDEILTTKYESFEESAKIYVSFSSNTRELKRIRCVRYDKDGNRGSVDYLELTPIDENGRFFFELPKNSEFNEISIEPIVSNKTVTISMTASCGETEINDGNWFITTRGKEALGNGSINIDSSAQYSVSYQFDSSKYYYVSSSPKRILAVDDSENQALGNKGTVVFSMVDATENESYSVLLKQYVSLEFDKNSLRKISSIRRVSTGEELDVQNISSYKFKNGESLAVTMDINSVLEGAGVIVDSSLYSGNLRHTTITIPENNVSSVLYLHSADRASKDISIKWIIEDDVVSIPGISISCGKDIREYRSGKKTDSIFMIDGDVLFIDIKKPSDRTSVSIKIDGIEIEDTADGFAGSYLFGNIDSITITVRNGYRFNSSLIENGEHLKVNYLLGSTTVKNGQFIPNGSVIDLFVDCPYEFDALNKNLMYTNQKKYGHLQGTIKITSQTGIEDFIVTEKSADGYDLDPDYYNSELGSVEFFKESGGKIKEKSFIRYEDHITFNAIPQKGYFLNYKINGRIKNEPSGTIPTDEVSVNAFFESLEFVRNEVRILRLPQPEVGGTIKYKDENGRFITEDFFEGKAGDKISAEFHPIDYFIPQKQLDSYTISNDSDIQTFPISDAFEEFGKPELMIVLCGTWNDRLKIGMYNETEESIIEYPSGDTSASAASEFEISQVNNDRIISGKDLISRVVDYSLFISGYSLKSTELLEVSVIYAIGNQNLGNVYYSKGSSTKITLESLLSQDNLKDTEKLIIKLQIVDGFIYSPVEKDGCSVVVSRTNIGKTAVQPGEFIASNEKIILNVTPEEGYYIESGKGKKEYIDAEINGEELSKTIEGVVVKPLIIIGLVNEDEFGSYSYTLNGKAFEGTIIGCREDDTLKVEFRTKKGFAIKGTLNKYRYSKTIKGEDLKKLNNTSLSFDSLGIAID